MPSMNVSPAALKEDLREGLSALETLRDEIRVRLHLAGLEAKDKWSELETQLLGVEDAAKSASATSRERLHEALDKLREFRAGLK
jgi:hypothetical protein